MRCKNILVMFAIAAAFAASFPAASTVTLTGGCQTYIINSTKSYITFNVTNSGDGGASDLTLSTSFPGITPANSTQVIQNVSPSSSYSKRFYISNFAGNGSYAVNFEATYTQAGNGYATVFPCVINIGSLSQGPLFGSASVRANRLYINVTNTASQVIQANVTAVVPPSFSVNNPTKTISVPANGRASVYFDVAAPTYTDASFPLTGELSYRYNGYHYAQISSAAFIFGSSASSKGIGLSGLALIAVVIIILALIVISLVVKNKGKGK